MFRKRMLTAIIVLTACLVPVSFLLAASDRNFNATREEIIEELSWISQPKENRCGGHYLEAPIIVPESLELDKQRIQITSDQLLFAQRGTSVGEGKVVITRYGQEITANKAYLYRDPETGKVSAIELIDDIKMREPNSLVVAAKGRFNLQDRTQSLRDILYRTAIYSDSFHKPHTLTKSQLRQPNKVTQLTAWGKAKSFEQNEPDIYEFDQASYSTCPPDTRAWHLKASQIVLNKETGRGYATNARIYVKDVPIYYTPYINFPIDSRRKTGFLWPTVGSSSSYGMYARAPFYWNMAPDHDMTITPTFISKRGLQVIDVFRYLTPQSEGDMNVEILPSDRAFADFQQSQSEEFGSSTDPVVESELRRLEQASTTRKAFDWQNKTRFNDHWSSTLDYNWVSDDYYLRDFSSNINQVTQNQLLQTAELDYKNTNWNSMLRLQGYQTLHPVDDPSIFLNQYIRLPQFVLNADYPEMPGGMDYFIDNELTHFDIRANPGSLLKQPIGNRLNMQPGFSRPITLPYLTITPRLQMAVTKYSIGDVTGDEPKTPSRVLPIFDMSTSMYFDRDIQILPNFRQTLEPQVYYVYIPYRNQDDLPVFDTTVNTLTYDQLFTYNRFSGIDRINDANQVGLGVSTRFIDKETGVEKIKAAVGQILYFKKRSVTLCGDVTDPLCTNAGDTATNQENTRNRSPLTGLITYNVNPDWSATANTIWNAQTDKVDNQSIALHYQPPNSQKIVNLGYNFVRMGDYILGDNPNSGASNLSQTDLSFSWPVMRDWSAVARWTQNWNHHHFQNLLYGLQYDSCCWAVRLVSGRFFTTLSTNSTFEYNTQFYLQFALKGLGSMPAPGGEASPILTSNISGYQSNFGRDF